MHKLKQLCHKGRSDFFSCHDQLLYHYLPKVVGTHFVLHTTVFASNWFKANGVLLNGEKHKLYSLALGTSVKFLQTANWIIYRLQGKLT